jgi:glycerophosphoryl diester phosphodiesterase
MHRILRRALAAVGAAAAAAIMVGGNIQSAQATDQPMTVISHRCNVDGSSYVENTALQCIRSVAHGHTFLDGDIRFTSTGVPYILHDSTLALFNCSQAISSVSTPTALSCLADNKQQGQTLFQFMLSVKAAGPNARVSLEAKVNPTSTQWAAINTALSDAGVSKSQVLWNGFDRATLAEADGEGFPLIGLACNCDMNPASEAAYIDVFVQSGATLDATTAAAYTAAGKDVATYDFDGSANYQTAEDRGVDYLYANTPDAAQTWVDSH